MKTKKAIFFIWLLLVSYLVLLLNRGLGAEKYFILKIIFLFGPLLGIIISVAVANLYGKASVHRKSYVYFAVGMLCIFLGELILLLFEMGWIVKAFFLPDIFNLLSYLAFFGATYNEIKLGGIKIFAKKNFYWFGLFLVAGVVVFAFEKDFISFSLQSRAPLLLIYSIFDLGLLFACIILMIIAREYKQGRMSKPWLILGLASICLLFGDILSVISNSRTSNDLAIKEIVYLVWLAGVLVYVLAMSHFSQILIEKREEIISKTEEQKNNKILV